MSVTTVHQTKTHLSKLIAAAERGEDVVIARGSTPVARIVPISPAVPTKRQFGVLKGLVAVDDSFFDPLPEDELRLWEGDDGRSD